jgi:hypothetical protein
MLKGGDLHLQFQLQFFPVATMKRNIWVSAFGLMVMVLGAARQPCSAKEPRTNTKSASRAVAAPGSGIDFFDAMDAGQINAKFIALNDHEAKLILTNNTAQPLNLKMPEAFAGVPVAAQFGGGGGARGGGRTGGGSRGSTGGGGQQQSVGGGGGGGLGGGGGGGGGFFSLPPDKTEKIELAVVCLDHGLRDPSSSAPYKIVPADTVVNQPAVVELLKAFGRGELKHGAAQAAAWNLNNDLSWQQLAAKLTGTKRSFHRSAYFSADDIRSGMSYATEASRLAAANAEEYRQLKKLRAEKAAKLESSDKKSTTDTDSKEAKRSDDASSKEAAASGDEKKQS